MVEQKFESKFHKGYIGGEGEIEEATSRKIFGKGRTAAQAATLLANASEAGSPTMRKDAEKLMPELAGNNPKALSEVMAARNPVTNANYTTAEAQKDQLR